MNPSINAEEETESEVTLTQLERPQLSMPIPQYQGPVKGPQKKKIFQQNLNPRTPNRGNKNQGRGSRGRGGKVRNSQPSSYDNGYQVPLSNINIK